MFPHLFEKEKFKTPPTSMKRQTLRTSARQGKHKAFSSAKQILPPCPPAGGGVHSWLFRTAFTLHKSGRSPLEIALFLADGSSQCGRNVSRREIEEAIENSNPIAMSTILSSRLRTIGKGKRPLLKGSSTGCLIDGRRTRECTSTITLPMKSVRSGG